MIIIAYSARQESQDVSCDGCISTRICKNTSRTYLQSFSKLFDPSLSSSPCELYLNDSNPTDIERSSVELFSNTNYLIRCPICAHGSYDIYYVISRNNILKAESCSSGIHGTIIITVTVIM